MYICVCHGISDGTIREAACRGAGSAKEVFRRLGVRPQCGTCVSHMSVLVEDGAPPARAQGQPSVR
jgi:bacterioferritin-associated ferredoxin